MDWSEYPNFTEAEFACRCGCGKADMQPRFMELLQAIRTEYGKPMRITSGFRCEEHNERVGGGPEHPVGWAADISVSGADAMNLVSVACAHGVRRVGVSQRASKPRFIHLGMSPDLPQAIWGY